MQSSTVSPAGRSMKPWAARQPRSMRALAAWSSGLCPVTRGACSRGGRAFAQLARLDTALTHCIAELVAAERARHVRPCATAAARFDLPLKLISVVGQSRAAAAVRGVPSRALDANQSRAPQAWSGRGGAGRSRLPRLCHLRWLVARDARRPAASLVSHGERDREHAGRRRPAKVDATGAVVLVGQADSVLAGHGGRCSDRLEERR